MPSKYWKQLAVFFLPSDKFGYLNKQSQAITKSQQDYATAYDTHYEKNNLEEAFDLYRDVIENHPDSQEAVNSREQIANIMRIIVPAKVRFDFQISMMLCHFKIGRFAHKG